MYIKWIIKFHFENQIDQKLNFGKNPQNLKKIEFGQKKNEKNHKKNKNFQKNRM